MEFIIAGRKRMLIDFNGRFYGQMALDIVRGMDLPALAYAAAIGATDLFDVWLSLFATVIVAVAFQSMRERAQRIANRLVYGRRASPYEVLANFSQGLAVAVSPDELLPRMARATAQGLGAARARVRVYVPGSFDRAVGWPPDMINAAFERTVPVLHQGAWVGEISVSKSSSEPFTRTEERLLADLAAQSGAAINGVRLDVELQARLPGVCVSADGERRDAGRHQALTLLSSFPATPCRPRHGPTQCSPPCCGRPAAPPRPP